MMSVNERDDLVGRVVERNYAKCIERGATPYRVVDEGRGVEVYDALDGSWRLLHAFDSKAAREKWERAPETREAYVPANGLAHMAGKPFSARVVRLALQEETGIIVVKEAPGWRHADGFRLDGAAAELRALADDDATIIDADHDALLRLLEPLTLAEGADEGRTGIPACPTRAEAEELSTPNAERPTLKGDEQSDTPSATVQAGAVVMLALEALEEHPKAMAFWPDSEQRRESVEGIHASVRLMGVRQPLTVCRRPDGGWWVVDGCTRLAAARAAGLAAVQCRVVDATEETIDDEIFVSNMERTRFGTGMRVMRYLERNMADVLETAKRNADPRKTGAMGGRGNKAAVSDTAFSAKAIAERLKVSNKDVLAGIELLQCRYGNLTVRCTDRGERTMVEATEEEREGIEEAYRRVLEGTPLRRWVPAARGRAATEGKARSPTDYGQLAARTLVSLGTLFAHWDELSDASQASVVKIWKRTVAHMPPDVLMATRKLLPPM